VASASTIPDSSTPRPTSRNGPSQLDQTRIDPASVIDATRAYRTNCTISIISPAIIRPTKS
jgi:hypothetical protein